MLAYSLLQCLFLLMTFLHCGQEEAISMSGCAIMASLLNSRSGLLYKNTVFYVDSRYKNNLALPKREVFSKTNKKKPFTSFSFLKNWRWAPLPLGIGLALIAYKKFSEYNSKKHLDDDLRDTGDIKVALYRYLPWRTISRVWGWMHSVPLPVWARKSLLGTYVDLCGCQMEEAEIEDLAQYKNLGELFRRSLKPNVRPLEENHCIISPADGKILSFGPVTGSTIEQIKGVTYSIKAFLGPLNWMTSQNKPSKEFYQNLKCDENNELYHCVIYLAPGDYHRFHSPTDWDVHYRRHFPGDLLSVNPGVASWIEGLFHLNERVVYYGEWEHGFFSMAAIGATNVGSIQIYFDPGLKTNKAFTRHKPYLDERMSKMSLKKGEPIGEFNLGSTVVLIFEAPKNFTFKTKLFEKVRVGKGINGYFYVPENIKVNHSQCASS